MKNKNITLKHKKICVVGLGYVGLPLAIEFGKIYYTVGFDCSKRRIDELKNFYDRTGEISKALLTTAKYLRFTFKPQEIRQCNIFVICVPTPVDKHNKPDLSLLISATKTVGKVLKRGDLVIYESTVYPGCTEEDCVPILKQESGLKFNKDFFVGYSPERVNPGDKEHTIPKIKKITSGSTPEAAELVDALYQSIITVGTHQVSSIKVAEAAKVIENTQRDINIAFINELALIFNRMGIDTHEVLEAAATKWNFLHFVPGLVGGHCIGVDPFYLTHKAQELGYHPEIILAGRRLNDNMGKYVAGRIVKLLIKRGQKVAGSKILILGLSFKENCSDIRNSKVIDVIKELKDFGCKIEVYDPKVDIEEAEREYSIKLINKPGANYNAIVLAVAHNEFRYLNLRNLLAINGIVYDVKGFLERTLIDERL